MPAMNKAAKDEIPVSANDCVMSESLTEFARYRASKAQVINTAAATMQATVINRLVCAWIKGVPWLRKDDC